MVWLMPPIPPPQGISSGISDGWILESLGCRWNLSIWRPKSLRSSCLLKPSGWRWSCSCVDNPQSCPPYIWMPSCLRNAVAAPSLRGFPISPCCWAFRFGGQSVAEEEGSWASFPCRRGAQLSCRAPLPPLYHQPSWSHHISAVCLCQGEIYAPCTLLRTTLKLNSSEGNQLCFIPAVVMEWWCVVWRFHKYLFLKLLPSCALCFSPLK